VQFAGSAGGVGNLSSAQLLREVRIAAAPTAALPFIIVLRVTPEPFAVALIFFLSFNLFDTRLSFRKKYANEHVVSLAHNN
jgi:hypothetical protein